LGPRVNEESGSEVGEGVVYETMKRTKQERKKKPSSQRKRKKKKKKKNR